jgi:hypothetical protein
VRRIARVIRLTTIISAVSVALPASDLEDQFGAVVGKVATTELMWWATSRAPLLVDCALFVSLPQTGEIVLHHAEKVAAGGAVGAGVEALLI